VVSLSFSLLFPQADEEEEDFWEKLLASRYEEFAKESEEAMGKGRRTRSKLVRYSEVQQLEQEESLNVRERVVEYSKSNVSPSARIRSPFYTNAHQGVDDEDYSEESSGGESEKDSQGVAIPRGPGRPPKKPRVEGQPAKPVISKFTLFNLLHVHTLALFVVVVVVVVVEAEGR
jgi:hypothetical protein